MYIGGAGVARGYLNRPELTAESFVPDPFSKHASARMYKSGDVARFLPQGDIDFLGRRDSQVKIHGFRIELGEIEATLAKHSDVLQVAVVPRKDDSSEAKLVAYFVTKTGTRLAGSSLREFLEAKIPAHMVPYRYVHLDALPLNPNGKVDRAKLPAPESAAGAREREYVAPNTPQEKILAGILAEVLKIERVGLTDNLFELGADSLHVFQITSRTAKAGLPITPRLVLEQRTIASMLAEMAKDNGVSHTAKQEIKPVARENYRVNREASHTVETKG
jgi:hypothetical protein